MNFEERLVRLPLFFVTFLLSLCFHEYAHGWMAKRKGDRTAEQMGRLTLDPMAHADWIGTFALPIVSFLFASPILFGWAKPVPVNPNRMKSPRKDMFWVALAGPLSNLLLATMGAFIFAVAYRYFTATLPMKGIQEFFMSFFIPMNMFLCVFNLIPLHPLDGGKVLARFLPDSINQKLEDNQMMTSMVLMALIFTGILNIFSYPVYLYTESSINLFLRLLP